MKRIAICLFALLMVVSLVSCGGNDDAVPQGYQRASNAEVCDYHLYVPDTWIAKSGTAQNFTSATVAPGDKCNVSVMLLEGEYGQTIPKYWEEQQKKYNALYDTFTVVSAQEVVTVGSGEGSVDGLRYVFVGDLGEGFDEVKQMQIFFIKGNSFYCFTYTAFADHYDNHLEAVNGILTNFAFK